MRRTTRCVPTDCEVWLASLHCYFPLRTLPWRALCYCLALRRTGGYWRSTQRAPHIHTIVECAHARPDIDHRYATIDWEAVFLYFICIVDIRNSDSNNNGLEVHPFKSRERMSACVYCWKWLPYRMKIAEYISTTSELRLAI